MKTYEKGLDPAFWRQVREDDAYAERLRSFCGIDHFQNPKVGRMAAFFRKGFLTEDVQLTFADADPHNSYNFGIMHFLHNTYPDAVEVPPERHGSYGDRMARMCFQLRSLL